MGNDKVSQIAEKIYSKKSLTFNKGKIGNWKHILDSKSQDFINQKLEENISNYGYNL